MIEFQKDDTMPSVETKDGQRAAVVLVHYGEPDLTRTCLESLAALETASHFAVVVDNGPRPGLGNALAGAHPDFTVLPSLDNPGFGPACNLGAKQAFERGASAVWFLNNDAVIAGPVLQPLLERARANPEIALWGTHQINGRRYQGSDRQSSWFHRGIAPTEALPPSGGRLLEPAETLGGASLLVTRKAWERLGPWPEQLFLYWEDAAWCRRAHVAGLPIALADLAIVHRSARTVGKRSPRQAFYSARNRLLLHQEYHPEGWLERVWIWIYLFQMRLFQGRPDLWGATWNGIRAATIGSTGRDPRY
jgi:GT2 family glycosyltransferase